MVGHLDVRALDPGMPSSLSQAVVTGLLRERLGFRGLAVTDSLQMGAVVERFGRWPRPSRAEGGRGRAADAAAPVSPATGS